MEKQFLHVGTKELFSNLTAKIYDGDVPTDIEKQNNPSDLKPFSGLWASDFTSINFNPWIDKLLTKNSVTFSIRRNGKNVFDACVITLKEDAKIFVIDSQKAIDELIEKYPNKNYYNWFSYEKLSQDYDGLYINDTNIFISPSGKIIDFDLYSKLYYQMQFNSLILFNTKPIDYYYEAKVIVDKNDSYTINVSDEKKYVKKMDESSTILINTIMEYLDSELAIFNDRSLTITNKIKAIVDEDFKDNKNIMDKLNIINELVDNRSIYINQFLITTGNMYGIEMGEKYRIIRDELKKEIINLYNEYNINSSEKRNEALFNKLVYPSNELLLGTIKKIAKEKLGSDLDNDTLNQIFTYINNLDIESNRTR